MKKQISILIIFISILFFIIACDDNKKEEVNDSDTEEVSDDDGDCPVTVPVEHNGEEITAAANWSGFHLIKGTLGVKAPLAMDKCTHIIMDSNSRISVSDGGSIKVNGTVDNIVEFVSAKTIPAAGDWKGIEIQDTASSGSSFQFVSFFHGGGDDYGVIWTEGEAEVAIDNCIFNNIQNYGIVFENGSVITSFTGNQFNDIGTYPVYVGANAVPALSPIVTDDSADRIMVRAEDIDDEGTWKNLSIGYEIDYLYIHKPVTIEAGNTLFMRDNSHVDLADGGSIIAVGTELAPIVFTSAKEGPGAGDWKQITVHDTASNDTKFEFVNFEFGGGDDYGLIWVDAEAAVSIDNCKFSDIQGTGIIFDNGAEIGSFTGNEFVRIDTYPITIGANAVPALSPIVTDDATNRIYVTAEDIDDAGTWMNLSIGYEIEYLYIHKPVTIEAGTTLFMRENGHINTENGGALTLDGTEASHVTVTSYKDAPAAGDWKQIEIYDSGSDANVFNYADIMYGGSDEYGQLWVESGAKITLNNVVFSNGQTCDVLNDNGEALITDNNSTYTACVE